MITLIAAMTPDRVIGKGNDLPWHIPEDLKNFKRLTAGHPCVMGRKTFESIVERLGKPLPGRKNIVLSRSLEYSHPDVEVFSDMQEALQRAQQLDEHVFVIGGSSVYEQALEHADRLCISWVNKDVDGDAYFPKVDWKRWKVAVSEKREGFRYVEYLRR